MFKPNATIHAQGPMTGRGYGCEWAASSGSELVGGHSGKGLVVAAVGAKRAMLSSVFLTFASIQSAAAMNPRLLARQTFKSRYRLQ
jgi:hypothetical protein